MRISDPKLFNGQTLATKQQISAWLAGTTTDNGFGTLNIPSANISGLSELATAVSNNTTNISTISDALGTRAESLSGTAWGNISDIWGKLSELTGQDMTGGGLNLGSLDQRLTAVQTKVSVLSSGNYIEGNSVASDLKALDTNLKTVSGDLDTLETTVGELSSWKGTFVDQTAVVEGTGLAEVTSSDPVNGVKTFTVNVPSGAAFTNHTITLAKLAEAKDGYASSYQLMVDGDPKGDAINIPKDQFLKAAAYNKDTESLEFTFEINKKDADGKLTSDQHTVSIDAKDLVHEYKSGDGIYVGNTVSGTSVISAVIDTDSESFLTVGTKGLKLSGVSDAITGAVSGKADSSVVNAIDGRLTTAESTLSGKADISTVNGIESRLATAESTLSGKAEQKDLEAVSDKLVGITGTVSSVIDAAVSGANAKLEGIETVSGAIDAAKTAVISEVKLVEQTLTFNNGKATVTTAGRVLQVFDSTGVCWPDITYSEAGIATINIGTDAESTTGYSAVIVKKTNIDIAE